MTFKVIPGLVYNGLPVGYDDSGAVTTTPVPTPTPQPSSVPPYINPVPSRSVILKRMPWTPSTRIYSDTKLDDHNIWLIPFTTAGFTLGSFSAGEWIDQPSARIMQVIRNRDAVVVVSLNGVQTPSFNFIDTVPLQHSGKIQLDHNETYTIAIWNQTTALGAGRMFCELQFKP